MNSKIFYSIEFLRGLLATTVAICHLYLSQNNNIHLETISSLCVEVFFIISGFVLAPQLIKVFNTNNLYSLIQCIQFNGYNLLHSNSYRSWVQSCDS